jgi:CheY-like chemotaxis protein
MISRTALVVEDDPGLRTLYVEALEGRGFHCMKASDGEEAIDQLSSRRFDVILLDLHLPRVDGRQVIQWVVQHGLDTPIVVSTGDHDAKLGAISSGSVRKVFHKPATIATLLESMEEAIAQPVHAQARETTNIPFIF